MSQMTQTCTYCRTDFGVHLTQCPNCGTMVTNPTTESPFANQESAPAPSTRLPIFDMPSSVSEFTTDDAAPFRPIHRPAAAALCVLFDGETQLGQWHFLRNEETIIGRGEVDVSIAHDAAISARHAAIFRRRKDDEYRWLLRELECGNGVFIRTDQAELVDGCEFVAGASRWRFQMPVAEPDDQTNDSTQAWQSLSMERLGKLVPSLVEVTAAGDGRTFPLRADTENQIGCDSGRANIVVDDPFVSPCHAVVQRDGGSWRLSDANSLNGTWVRVEEVVLDDQSEFQLGEQRFRFHLGK